jgi:7-carboxy-7-deazaguanine synthase
VVNGSPFLTIQGEGPYAGYPAVFVRLHGCHLRCTFCDTEFDNPADKEVDTEWLVRAIKGMCGPARLVVITGGEPMRQNILPLCQELFNYGFNVQIETAGTFWVEGLDLMMGVDIVCSPKTPTIHLMIYENAKAFKYVISGTMQFSGGRYGYVPITSTHPLARAAQLALPRPGCPVYLSPCDEGNEVVNRFNRQLVGSLAMEYGVIAGLQLHKFMELA